MEIWSIGTALRNPTRIPGFLCVLQGFFGRYWDEEAQLDYYIELIRQGVVTRGIISANDLVGLTQQQARDLMYTNYTDAPMRGRVLGSLMEKIDLINTNGGLNATNIGAQLLNGNIPLSEALIEGLAGWQYVHDQYQYQSQWQGRIENFNLGPTYQFSPFIATLYLIGRVNQLSNNRDGITYQEYIYFAKTMDHYDLVELFARYIVAARNDRNLLIQFIQYVRANCQNLRNGDDYADNDIRYFQETGLIVGENPLNINYMHIATIRNIIANHVPNMLPI